MSLRCFFPPLKGSRLAVSPCFLVAPDHNFILRVVSILISDFLQEIKKAYFPERQPIQFQVIFRGCFNSRVWICKKVRNYLPVLFSVFSNSSSRLCNCSRSDGLLSICTQSHWLISPNVNLIRQWGKCGTRRGSNLAQKSFTNWWWLMSASVD